MTDKEALKLALEFVTSISSAFICEATHHTKKEQHEILKQCPHVEKQKRVYAAIKEALAQPEQEPVAWISPSGALYRTRYHAVANAEQSLTPLYTHPAPALPAKAPAAVGWQIRIGDSPDWSWSDSETDADFYGKQSGLNYEKRPLYITQPAAQRKPLTDEQRQELMSKAWNEWLSRKDDGRLFAWSFSFEVEAAHGIKENT